MGTVPLGVIEPQSLFQVWSGGGRLSAIEQDSPQGMMGLEQEIRVSDLLGQGEQLLP